jgi:hypothetical protein
MSGWRLVPIAQITLAFLLPIALVLIVGALFPFHRSPFPLHEIASILGDPSNPNYATLMYSLDAIHWRNIAFNWLLIGLPSLALIFALGTNLARNAANLLTSVNLSILLCRTFLFTPWGYSAPKENFYTSLLIGNVIALLICSLLLWHKKTKQRA